MNAVGNTFLVASLLLFGLFLFLAIRYRNNGKTALDFLLYGGKLSLTPLVGTMVATNLSLGNMIFVCATMGYFFGWGGVFWMTATIVLMAIGYSVFASQFREYIESPDNFGSIHDYLAITHAGTTISRVRAIRRIASTVSCLSLLLAVVLELHLATSITLRFFPVDQGFVYVLLVGITVAYSMVSGFRSVVTTDVAQSIFLIVATICGVAFFLLLPTPRVGVGAQFPSSFSSIVLDVGYPTIIGFCVIGLGWLLCTPDTWQRNCASRNAQTSVRGVFIGSTILAVLVSLFAVAGMLVKTHVEPLTTASQSLSKGAFPLQDMFLLAGQTGAGDFLLAMIALGLVVAAISTADTFVVVATHSLSVDFLPHLQGDTSLSSNADDKSELTIFRARVMTACLGAAVLLLWYTLRSALDNPVGAFFVVYTVQFALLSPVVFGFWDGTRSYLAALTGMLCGVSTAVLVGLWTLIGAGDRTAFAGFTANDVTSLLPAIVFVVGAVTHLLVLTFDKSSRKKK